MVSLIQKRGNADADSLESEKVSERRSGVNTANEVRSHPMLFCHLHKSVSPTCCSERRTKMSELCTTAFCSSLTKKKEVGFAATHGKRSLLRHKRHHNENC